MSPVRKNSGLCSVCRCYRKLNADGLLKLHRRYGKTCDGSARPPVQPRGPEPQDPNARLPSVALRRTMLERDGYRCRKCGYHSEDGSALEAHHVVPFAKGGKTELDNLHSLCGACHAELTWIWLNEPPGGYEAWLDATPAATLLRMLLLAADRGDGTEPLSADAIRAVLGIDRDTARRLLGLKR